MKTLPPLYTSTRLLNVFRRLKIEYLEDLAAMSAYDFRDTRNVGLVLLEEAREILADNNMAFEVDSEQLLEYSPLYKQVREGIKRGTVREYR